jgi:hypothetical protein
MAAVLACRSRCAVLSHRSAAALWCVRPRPARARRVRITAPRWRAARRTFLLTGRSPAGRRSPRATASRSRRRSEPTSTSRRHPAQRARRALNEAEIHMLPGPLGTDARRIQATEARATLRTLLLNARRSSRQFPTEGEFRRFRQSHGPPEPRPNPSSRDDEATAVWRDARLIARAGRLRHPRTRRAFERDRARDRRLTVHGWRTMRVTSPDLTAELAAELLSSIRA